MIGSSVDLLFFMSVILLVFDGLTDLAVVRLEWQRAGQNERSRDF